MLHLKGPSCAAALQVNFKYKEAEQQKQALVKLRVCPTHALHLNHKANAELLRSPRKQRNKRKREDERQDEKLLARLREEALQQTRRPGVRADLKSRTAASSQNVSKAGEADSAAEREGAAERKGTAVEEQSEQQPPDKDFGTVFEGMFL